MLRLETHQSHFSDRKSKKHFWQSAHIYNLHISLFMCHGFATVPPRHLVFRFFCLLAESFLVFECCLVVLILGGKTFSAAAVWDGMLVGTASPLMNIKTKCGSWSILRTIIVVGARQNITRFYIFCFLDATLWPQKWQLNVIAKLCSIICMERCGMKLWGGNDSFKCACLGRYNEASSLDGSYKEKLLWKQIESVG